MDRCDFEQITKSLWKWKIMLVVQLCPTLCDFMDCSPAGSSVRGNFPGQNTGVGGLSLLQGIFPTQGSNPGLPHCRWILYEQSHQGSLQFLPLWNGNSIYLVRFLWGLNLKMNIIFSSVLALNKWAMFVFEKLFLIFTRSYLLLK